MSERRSGVIYCDVIQGEIYASFHRQLMFILEAKLFVDIFIRRHEMFSIRFPIVFLPNEIRSYFPRHYMCGEVGPRLKPQQLL